jgi:ribose transport system substrate-binding protein
MYLLYQIQQEQISQIRVEDSPMYKQFRKMKKCGKRAAALLLLFSMVLTGCAGGSSQTSVSTSESEAGVKIGFVVKNKTNDFWRLLEEGAEEEGAAKNAEITFYAPGSDKDAQSQIKEIQKLIDEKVDVICVAPISDEMLLPALEDASDAGIHVIAVDTDSSLGDKETFVGTDNYAAAKAGALRAAEALAGNENANAVILRGYLGDTTHDARESGISDGLSEKGIRVEKSVESTEDTAADDVTEILSEFPSLSLIITTSDDLTKGAYDAIAASGRTDVKLYGFDGRKDVAELISADSFLIGTTAQDPYEMGKRAVDDGVRAAGGEEVPQNDYSSYEILDSDNVSEYLKNTQVLLDKLGDSADE